MNEPDQNNRVHRADPGTILVSDNRHRKSFARKPLDLLIESMKDLGQLQPIVCTKDSKGSILLIAGERRLRACIHGKMEVEFILKEEVTDPLMLERIELEENLVRENLSWQEEVAAGERLHAILQKMAGPPGLGHAHGVRDTAEFLGAAKSIVAEDIALAVWVRENPEVATAPSKTVAKKIVKRLTETVVKGEALEEALEKSRRERERMTVREGGDAPAPPASEEERVEGLQQERLLYYDKRCKHGELAVVMPDLGLFDVVAFDPPWDVAFDTVSKMVPGKKMYKDQPEVGEMLGWIQGIWHSMSDNSHLYMFFGIVHHNLIYNMLEEVGFTTNRIPIIWWKRGAHRTRNPSGEHGRSYEPIAFAQKGSKPLARLGRANLIDTPAPTLSMKGIHPNAKHPEVYQQLLLASCSPGDRVLDPMAGSGMFGVAAEDLIERLALDWWMIEKDEDFRNLQIYNLSKGYLKIIGEVSKEQEERPEYREDYQAPAIAEDFRELTPKSSEWKQYWEAHPEQQDEMLRWKLSSLQAGKEKDNGIQ